MLFSTPESKVFNLRLGAALSALVGGAIALSALFGHLTRHEIFYRWGAYGRDPGMALATAAALCILSVGLFMLAYAEARSRNDVGAR